ncbi:MAG: ATP-dependent zinc metalloprotease FtsH [Acidimicrobiales bacterium]
MADTTTKKQGRVRRPVIALGASLLALGLIYAAALTYVQPASPGREISLDTLSDRIPNGDVREARFLDEDARITGTIVLEPDQPPVRYWVSYPRSDAATNDLLKQLLGADTEVTVDPQSTKGLVRFLAQFLLPLVILANLFALLFYLVRGGSSGAEQFLEFGQVGDKMLGAVKRERTTFANVAGSDEAIVELAEVRDYLAEPASFKRMGALPPKGVLLIGPPGCGKTLLARAVAGEADANFFAISGSEFVESLVGVGAARVRDLFRQARAATPSIVFIDELDAVGRQRGAGLGGGHDEREQTLNELLVQMDGFSPTEGVAVLAATNRVDILDPALLRPGRFDRHITIEKPDREGRLEILHLHAKGRKLVDAERHLPIVARQTPGFTGADLASVLNEAALLAVRERASAINAAHLEEAVERVVGGPRRKAVIIPDKDKRRIALHESGHAVVAAGLGQSMALDKLSIIARGRGVGHLALLAEDSMLPTRTDMEARIAIAMAGVAAEELVLGEISVGSESDLERATNAARDMAGRFGMSDRLGRVRVLREEREIFLGRDYLLTRDVSQPTLEHLDGEVRRILDEQESRARAILAANRPVLEDLASALSSAETLQGERLRDYLEKVKVGAPATRRSPAHVSPGATNHAGDPSAGDGAQE